MLHIPVFRLEPHRTGGEGLPSGRASLAAVVPASETVRENLVFKSRDHTYTYNNKKTRKK